MCPLELGQRDRPRFEEGGKKSHRGTDSLLTCVTGRVDEKRSGECFPPRVWARRTFEQTARIQRVTWNSHSSRVNKGRGWLLTWRVIKAWCAKWNVRLKTSLTGGPANKQGGWDGRDDKALTWRLKVTYSRKNRGRKTGRFGSGADKSGLVLVLLPDAEFEPAASPTKSGKTSVCTRL